jgi:predicted nucleic acid-binding protein
VTVFVDTSAIYAATVATDSYHRDAAATLHTIIETETLVTHNYVAVETLSLLHARHGPAGARAAGAMLGVFETSFVDADLHARAFEALVSAGRDGPSFVDHVSFAVMDVQGIRHVFAYDGDFLERGYEPVG